MSGLVFEKGVNAEQATVRIEYVDGAIFKTFDFNILGRMN